MRIESAAAIRARRAFHRQAAASSVGGDLSARRHGMARRGVASTRRAISRNIAKRALLRPVGGMPDKRRPRIDMLLVAKRPDGSVLSAQYWRSVVVASLLHQRRVPSPYRGTLLLKKA